MTSTAMILATEPLGRATGPAPPGTSAPPGKKLVKNCRGRSAEGECGSVVSEVSVSVGETLDVGAHVVSLAERIAEEQVAGAADERGESHVVGAVGVVWLVGGFARVVRALPFVVHHCVLVYVWHAAAIQIPRTSRLGVVRGEFPQPCEVW